MEWEDELLKVLEIEELQNLLPEESKFLFPMSADHEGDIYITYQLIDENSSFRSGDKGEVITGYTVQIDLNSKKRDKRYRDIVKKIKKICKNADWIKGAIFEDKEEEAELYFICMRYKFNLITEGYNE